MRFASIHDECSVLPWRVKHRAMLGGGALRSYFDGTMVKDYDLFFESLADWQVCVTQLDADPAFAIQASAADTLYPTYVHIYTGRLFNLIGFRFYPNPQELAQSFDFRCTAMALRLRDPALTFYGVPGASEDCAAKALNFLNLQPTNRVAKRLRRYVDELGYTPTDDFVSKVAHCAHVTNPGCSYNGDIA